MLNPIVHKFQYGKHTVTIETGMIARQSTSAVMVNMDDTVVFVVIVGDKKKKKDQSFFPLTVNYQEKSYAAGKIPGSFFRREGRPNENEILISRLIDRPIRPLFPKGFINEIQIIATVMSINGDICPDIVSIIGASAALSLSEIPFNGPIGAARVGYIDNKYVLNPTFNELKKSKLDLIVSGTSNALIMVESSSNLLNEQKILDAIFFGYEKQQIVIKNINTLVSKVGNKKWDIPVESENLELDNYISKLSKNKLKEAYYIFEKEKRLNTINEIKEKITNDFLIKDDTLDLSNINQIFLKLEKKIVRKRILDGKFRIDGRKYDMIRPLDVRIGILPRTHGSALFTRGETQALVTVTLGTERDAQIVDELVGEYTDRFLFHYNFPPYAVGELGIIGAPKRREVGHGRLAKRGILSVLPKQEDFPYIIRVVSEITESNGSSSMASVCGASLALMDAGVPIKQAVAGIAMGLVKENNKFVILSDILGDEDYLGDMDFKVAGTFNGITALQMDIKIEGINEIILKNSLKQAKDSLHEILNFMQKTISLPKKEISEFAPRIHIIHIDPEKIKDVIGKGGSVIRALTEETGTSIEIDYDGTVKIAATDCLKTQEAIRRIEYITAKVEISRTYKGVVTKIVDFGAFVNIGGTKEGLVHISQITEKRVKKVSDYLEIGKEVIVKVLDIDRNGRIRLSMKDAVSSLDKFIK
ncbi:MAG: polyribonucleotide nucleotidyltransferase [Arsenophonus sp.]|nr:MAG: polyribonucleotide nucleotidyltransferase [Arsenophonus sp.]